MATYKINYKQIEHRSIIVDAYDRETAERMWADAAVWSKVANPRWHNSDTHEGVQEFDPEDVLQDIELLTESTTPTPMGAEMYPKIGANGFM